MTITGLVSGLSETAGSTPAFTISRSQAGQAQTVYVKVSGTATPGTDYTVNGFNVNNGNGVLTVAFAASDISKIISITGGNSWMTSSTEAISTS